MRVVISSGLGRLHLFSTATALSNAGLFVRLIGGWVPRKTNSLFVRLMSAIVGHDLSSGLKKRQIAAERLEVVSLGWVDFLDQFLVVFMRKLLMWFHVDPLWGWVLFGWRSKKYLRGCDVFHVRSGAGQGGAISYAKKKGVKVVVDHSIAHPAFMDRFVRAEYEKRKMTFDLGMDSKFWQMVLRDCAEADLLVVNSDFVKKTFVDTGYPEERIKVVYLGVSDRFQGLRKYPARLNHEFKFIFTGAFGFRKGGEYILEAIKILVERKVCGFSMDVIGSVSQGTAIINAYKSEALPVHFHGPMSQEKMSDFLKGSDIYVFPSLAEGCAKSGMEAMAAGLCVVATLESGLPIRDGETGFLVPSRDAVALADKLEWLMKNYDVVKATGQAAAKQIAAEYQESMYAEKLINVYRGLMEGRHDENVRH